MSEPPPRPLDHRDIARPSIEELLAHRKLWPVAEAAALPGCHPITLYKRAQAGTIELVKIGRRTYEGEREVAQKSCSRCVGTPFVKVGTQESEAFVVTPVTLDFGYPVKGVTLQRAAFVTEVQTYHDLRLAAAHQDPSCA